MTLCLLLTLSRALTLSLVVRQADASSMIEAASATTSKNSAQAKQDQLGVNKIRIDVAALVEQSAEVRTALDCCAAYSHRVLPAFSHSSCQHSHLAIQLQHFYPAALPPGLAIHRLRIQPPANALSVNALSAPAL